MLLVNDFDIDDFLNATKGPKRIHLIGVAGSGMSGLASLFMAQKHWVSGCDRVTTLETERMERMGLRFACPQAAEPVRDAQLVVYSSAIKPGNPAYDEAVARGIPLARRAEALAAVMRRRKGIVIAGTHGKTTTSALAAHVFRVAGLDPSHYVGAEIPILGTNAHWSEDGDYFVAEGDESDGTLVNFQPVHSVILNIEEEHLDFYNGLDEIKEVFRTLIANTSGSIIHCGDNPGAADVCGDLPHSVSYGTGEGNDYVASEIAGKGFQTEFTVHRRGELLGRAVLGIPGRHNVLNALGVIALASELGVAFEKTVEALESFRGARRRFDLKFQGREHSVVDDYGHHPTEIAATIETARQLRPSRLVCMFQPHRYTRTQRLLKEFGTAFDGADAVFVTDVYPASEPPIPGVTGEIVVDEIREHGTPEATYQASKERIHFDAGNFLRPGDMLLSLGAGDIHEAASLVARDLETLEKLREALNEPEAIVRLHEPMRKHTTLRVGGPAQFWVEPVTAAGMAQVIWFCRQDGIPLTVIGRGSNLLVRDGGIQGVVLSPSRGDFKDIRVDGDLIEAGAGVRFKQVASAAKKAGLAGFEWMEGIPGNVGGGLRMNAGAMGTETFDQVVSVRLVDLEGRFSEKKASEFAVEYRSVPELRESFAVSATFRGTPGDPEEIAGRMEASMKKRRESQPIAASAGCMFKNPEEIPAGKLVDELGLKNRSVGAARVSEVHGNFLVNDGGATAHDVLALIESVKGEVLAARGIELITEVQVLGQDEPIS